jgi:mono/diheme cytochrome c family protein
LAEKRLLGFWIEPLMKERKHTDTGLLEQLLDPARHHPDTAFPDFRLTRNEALQVAAYIRSRQPPRQTTPLTGDATAGAVVVEKSCIVCHAPSAGDLSLPSLETIAQIDWAVRGCAAEKRGRAPDLGLTAGQIAALLAFRNADRDVGMQSLRRFVPAEYAVRQIEALNCIQCHSGKDGRLPSIAIAGEKLRREWLEDLVAGRHPEKT